MQSLAGREGGELQFGNCSLMVVSFTGGLMYLKQVLLGHFFTLNKFTLLFHVHNLTCLMERSHNFFKSDSTFPLKLISLLPYRDEKFFYRWSFELVSLELYCERTKSRFSNLQTKLITN